MALRMATEAAPTQRTHPATSPGITVTMGPRPITPPVTRMARTTAALPTSRSPAGAGGVDVDALASTHIADRRVHRGVRGRDTLYRLQFAWIARSLLSRLPGEG